MKQVTLMVQIPDTFSPGEPCIVTAPSSGSRGIYGAIGTSGEWGLKNGCAIAYTDKGTGTGTHDLQDDTINLIDGVRDAAPSAQGGANFRARISDADRIAFNSATPDRFAFKHAPSEQNPEADWDVNVLQSIPVRFRRAEPPISGRGDPSEQHHRHRLQRVKWRRGRAAGGGNRSASTDRRRRRLRAERHSATGPAVFQGAPTSPSRRRR